MKKKRILGLIMATIVTTGIFVGCGGNNANEEKTNENKKISADKNNKKKDDVPENNIIKKGEIPENIQDASKYRPLKRYEYYKEKVDKKKNENLNAKDVLRYIEEYKGKVVNLSVTINQIVEEDGYQLLIGKRMYEDETFALKYVKKEEDPKVLKGDVIEIFGTILDEFKYKSTEGTDENIPLIEINYILGAEFINAQSVAYEYLRFMTGQLGTMEYIGTENQFSDLEGMTGSHVFSITNVGDGHTEQNYIVVDREGELMEFYPLGEDGLTQNGDKKNFVKVSIDW